MHVLTIATTAAELLRQEHPRIPEAKAAVAAWWSVHQTPGLHVRVQITAQDGQILEEWTLGEEPSR